MEQREKARKVVLKIASEDYKLLERLNSGSKKIKEKWEGPRNPRSLL